MTKMNGRGVEVAVRNATQGEGWVDDLQKVGPLPEGRGGARVLPLTASALLRVICPPGLAAYAPGPLALLRHTRGARF